MLAYVCLSHTLAHKHGCRCSSFDWWVRKCSQRASCSVTAVSKYTLLTWNSPSRSLPSLCSSSLPSVPLLLALLSLPVFPLWLSHARVNLSSRGVKCQLSRYGNKNKTQSHLKRTQPCSIVLYRVGWKPICGGLGVQTKEGKQLQLCQCQDCISISTHWQKVQQLPQSLASKYD